MWNKMAVIFYLVAIDIILDIARDITHFSN